MKREEVIKSLINLTANLAQEYNCTEYQCGEDRQKGIWGEEFTQYLEHTYGECTKEFTFSSEDKFIYRGYQKEDSSKPVRRIRFRYRFANPCIAIEVYKGQRQIFAEMEISDYGGKWHIGQFTIFDEDGMEFANRLRLEWHKIKEAIK